MAERQLANPAPLGLAGFALTTFVLNVHNAGIVELGAALPLGLFYGGLAQLCAGILEFATGTTFAHVAFSSYGAFWIALAAMVLFELNGIIPEDVAGNWLVWTLIAWTIFTAYMTVGTFGLGNRTLQIIFVSLLILFILLDIGEITGNTSIIRIAGWEGIWTAATAWYLSAAEIINPAFDREVLPIGAG